MSRTTQSLVPAAALAVGVLAPSWLPSRRAATLAGVAGARAWEDEQPDGEAFYLVAVLGTKVLTADTEHLVSRVATSLLVGAAGLLAVETVRAMPVGRVLGAAGVAAGYVWVDRRMRSAAARSVVAASDAASSAVARAAGDETQA